MSDSSVTDGFLAFADELEKMPQTVVKDAIDVAIDKLVKMLQESARFSEYSQGTLQQSIEALPIKKTSEGWIVEIAWENYGTYQDAGVQGTESGTSLGKELGYGKNFSYTDKMPPPSAFEQYARVNGISKFAIAKSIMRKGIKPTKWASNVLDSAKIDEALDEVAELIVKLYELE